MVHSRLLLSGNPLVYYLFTGNPNIVYNSDERVQLRLFFTLRPKGILHNERLHVQPMGSTDILVEL